MGSSLRISVECLKGLGWLRSAWICRCTLGILAGKRRGREMSLRGSRGERRGGEEGRVGMRLQGGGATGKRRGKSGQKTYAEGQRLGLAGIGRHRRGERRSRAGATEQLRHRATAPPDPPSSCATERRSPSASAGRGPGRLGFAPGLASSLPAGARGCSRSAVPARPQNAPLAAFGTAPLLPPPPSRPDPKPTSTAAPHVPAPVTGTRRPLPAPRARDHLSASASAGAARGRGGGARQTPRRSLAGPREGDPATKRAGGARGPPEASETDSESKGVQTAGKEGRTER
ncbi:atherin-like [Mustela erminea]|uniref:atherin-like n=1 Tax=Mustela erminea TaxID=36723 RepID=UPI001386AC7E|nr:atherin-like [Mustela erminea]